jgi:Na+-translocating ferredoxin:NAD+ oxidoreductase RnfG subunit
MNYGSDIDSISGATISANSITWDIIQVHEMMEKLVEENGLVFSKK